MWRGHSCLPRRDSSRRFCVLLEPRHKGRDSLDPADTSVRATFSRLYPSQSNTSASVPIPALALEFLHAACHSLQKYLGDREPIAALRETSARIGALTSKWSPADFERTYEPGKWSARLFLGHLAHIEIAVGMRVRMALTTPGYILQPFDQDRWMEHESSIDGRAATDAFLALDRLNADMFATLSPAADVATPVSHPEVGPSAWNG